MPKKKLFKATHVRFVRRMVECVESPCWSQHGKEPKHTFWFNEITPCRLVFNGDGDLLKVMDDYGQEVEVRHRLMMIITEYDETVSVMVYSREGEHFLCTEWPSKTTTFAPLHMNKSFWQAEGIDHKGRGDDGKRRRGSDGHEYYG